MATNIYGGRSPKQEELYGFNSLIYPNGKKPTRHSGTLGGNSIFNPLDLKNRTANKRSFSALNYAPINDKNYSAIYGHSSDPRKRNLPSLLNQPSNRQRPIGIANDGVKQTGTGTDNTPPNQKNNLLNYLISPQGKGMAQGLLEASGYSDTPVTFGQAIGMGLKRGTEAQTAADAAAAAKAAAQFEQDKFAYKQKDDLAKNYIELQKVLSKDNSSDLEKKMKLIHPNLVSGTQEYTDAALALIKSGAINLGGDKKTGWDQLEMGSANNLVALTTNYQSGFEKANNNNNSLGKLRRTIASIPSDKFGKLAETKLLMANFLNSVGIPIDTESQAMLETAYALGGEFVMGQIQLTKGAVSEKEMAYFDAISPNITKTKDGMLLMIKLAEHTNEFEKLKNEEYLKFKETWKEKKAKGLTAGDLETEWGKKLIELTNNQKLPQGIINDMENITLKGALAEWNENNDTAPILNPKNDKAYIAEQISGITNNNGDSKYVKDSQQFIGFTEDGRPKYLVEDFEGNFKTIAVTKGQ
jgi:hypothetical protein